MNESSASNRSSIVLADGCFDPLHIGHIRYLQAAAKMGDRLLVNVAPDTAIRAKGREPFQTLGERVEMLRALPCVHGTCSGDLATVIRAIAPEWLVKGSDWEDRLPCHIIQACDWSHTRIFYTMTQERTSTERLAS